MGWGDLFTKYGMFPGTDRQVTVSNPNQSRSESAIAVNPINESNLVAVSKKFIDPAKYRFTVEPIVSKDGGFGCGEYFGLDAFDNGFAVLWTDTRTGVQELFYDQVGTHKIDAPFWFTEGIVATLVGPGVAQGAGGWVIVGGKLVRVPPRGPKYALLQAIAALDAAEDIDHPVGQKVVQQAADAIAGIAKDLAKGKTG